MTTIFGQSIKPPNAQTGVAMDNEGTALKPTVENLSFNQQLWSWVASGYVVIPCDVGGTITAVELTPRFRPEIGASGYVDLLAWSFLSPSLLISGVQVNTIQVIGDKQPLDAMPVYVGNAVANIGDIVGGVPYIAFYCSAVLGLPDRIVIK